MSEPIAFLVGFLGYWVLAGILRYATTPKITIEDAEAFYRGLSSADAP